MPRIENNSRKWVKWKGFAVRVSYRSLGLRASEQITSLGADLAAWQKYRESPSSRAPKIRDESAVMAELQDFSINAAATHVRRLDAAEAKESEVESDAAELIRESWDAIADLGEEHEAREVLVKLWGKYSLVAPMTSPLPDEDELEPLELDAGYDGEMFDGDPVVAAWNDSDTDLRKRMLRENPQFLQALIALIVDRDAPSLLGK